MRRIVMTLFMAGLFCVDKKSRFFHVAWRGYLDVSIVGEFRAIILLVSFFKRFRVEGLWCLNLYHAVSVNRT